MIHYYFFNDLVNRLDNQTKTKLDYDDNLLFNLANFNTSPSFYKLFNISKRDKYKVQEYFDSDDFYSFLVECAINVQKDNDYKKLLFLYAMISHKILSSYLYPYITSLKSNTYTMDVGLNMLDFYFARRHGLDVTKESLYNKFKGGFIYHEYMDELIRYPMIKICKLMSSESYFTKCYKRKKKFYRKYGVVKYKIVWLKFTSLLYRKKGTLPKDFPYKKIIDANLLNVRRKEFILNDKTYNGTIDDLYEKAIKDSIEAIKALNLYLFDNNDKLFRKLFKIPEKKAL